MTRMLVERYAEESAAWQRQALAARGPGTDLDEPLVMRRMPGAEALFDTPLFRDWAGAMGYCDNLTSVLLQRRERAGLLGLARHESVGPATDREVALLRLLAPHLRRAVAIGDLLDMQALETAALHDSMDGLSVGIGVVAADGAILHANAAAKAMLDDAQGPIRRSHDGRLAGRRGGATEELRGAIAAAAEGATRIGGAGIGVALGTTEGLDPAAVAHVLPLAGGSGRRGLMPRAAAAVFVSAPRAATPAVTLDAVARSLGLTPAEARLLGRLVAGDSVTEAAVTLGVAASTARTHLNRIFGKTGTSRQAELVALVAKLAVPVRGA